MGEKSFAELRKIAAAQQEEIKKQDEITKALNQQVRAAQTANELRLQEINRQLHLELRRTVEQTVDFALRSLPWWNRSLPAVMKRAAKMDQAIKAETLRLVALFEAENLTKDGTDH